MPLSPREQRILAEIEGDLGNQDPDLTTTFARTRFPASSRRRWHPKWLPLSVAQTGALVLLLVVLIVAQPMALRLGPAGLGLLTAALVVPWVLMAARTGAGRPPLRAWRSARARTLRQPK